MNRMNRALIHRAAWIAGVLLLGLLLGSCGSAGPTGKNPEETREEAPPEVTPGSQEEVAAPGNQEEEVPPGNQGEEAPGNQGEEAPGDQGEGTAQGSQGEEAPGNQGEEAPGNQGEEEVTPGDQEEVPGSQGEEEAPGNQGEEEAPPDDQGEAEEVEDNEENPAPGITDLIGVWKSSTTTPDSAFYDIEVFYKIEFFEETITNTKHVSLKIKGTETISEDTGVETYSISRIDGANIHVVLTQKTRSKLAGSGNARQQIGDSYSIHVERNGDSLEIRWYDEHPEHNEPVSYTKEES